MKSPGQVAAAPTPRLPVASLALALLAAALCVATLTVFKVSNNDVWLQVATGKWIVANSRVPDHDLFSFISSGLPYVAHEWLSSVVLYAVYSLAGVNGLIFFKSLVICATFSLLYATSRRLGGRVSVFLPLLGVVAYIASERFIERPHIFTLLLTAAYLTLLFRFRDDGHDTRALYGVLGLQILWVNLHGGWVQGVAVVGTFAAAEALAWARARWTASPGGQGPSTRHVLPLLGLLPACLVATVLNPYGFRALLLPFELTGMKTFMASIYEWQPPSAPSFNTTTILALYVLLVVLLETAFFLTTIGQERASGGKALRVANRTLVALPALTGLCLLPTRLASAGALWRPEIVQGLLVGLLVFPVAFVALNWRDVDFARAGLLVLFYASSLRHNRAVTDAALVFLPVTCICLSEWLEQRRLRRAGVELRAGAERQAGRRKGQAPSPVAAEAPESRQARPDASTTAGVVCGSLALLLLAAHVLFSGYHFDFAGATREKGLGIASQAPTAAVDFLAARHVSGNAFVSYPFAALLIHRLYPRVKVNMDSRNEVYGETLYREYEAALSSREALLAYLGKYPVDFFLVQSSSLSPEVYKLLSDSAAWAVVYRDDLATVAVKRSPENEALIRELAPAFQKRRATLSFPQPENRR